MKRKICLALVLVLILFLSACVPKTDAYTIILTLVDFVPVIDNPYLPLIPGTKWAYEARLADGMVERNEIEVLVETRIVNGVTATVVHDLILVGGKKRDRY